MAKFVYRGGDGVSFITLQASNGEEIPTEMVAAWAAIRTASALEQISGNLIGLDNAISGIADAIKT